MNRFQRLLLPFLVLAGWVWAAEVRTLTILHVNDLHAHLTPDDAGRGGFAYLASAIGKQRAGCRDCILLNAGDLVQGTPVSTIFHGLPLYSIANSFKFDASTIGNHEFDYGWEMVPRFLKAAKFPVVSANIVDGSGRLMARPYIIIRVNGLRVGVIGVVMGDLPRFETPERMGQWKALPVVETVNKYVPEVRENSDLVVVLAHVNDFEADQILHQCPEVAVVVSGHNHTGLAAAEDYQGRLNVRINGYGRELGRLELKLREGRVASWQWKRIAIDSKQLQPEPAMAKLVAKWEGKVSKVVDIPIGRSTREIPPRELKGLVERAMREATGADFAFVNSGGIRDRLPQGKLLARHVWDVIPFDNVVVIGAFRGSEVPKKVLNGTKVDPNRTYRLAVTDFTAANQSERSQLGSKGLRFPQDGPLLRDLLIHWIERKQVVP